MRRLDPTFVSLEISQLLASVPELAEDEVLRADMIEAETGAHEFLSEVVRRIQAANANMRGIKAYQAQLTERRERMERREEALRGLIFKIMQQMQQRHLELPEASLTIRMGQPKVVVINEQEVPDQYMRIKKEPNKTLIKQTLQQGEDVPGCAMSNAEPVLAIST